MNNIIPYLGRGILHEQRGIPCQDAICYRRHQNGSLVMALSDGASQAKYAEAAAVRTVKSIRDFFERNTLSDFLTLEEKEQKTLLLAAVRRKLQEDEHFINQDAPEFSATALFVVMDEDNALFGHLGDGAIYAADENGTVIYSSDPDNHHDSAQTWFCVSADAERHLRLERMARKELAGVILISDGPYLMFRNRGKGDAAVTALSLMSRARGGEISGRVDLQNALNQMADIPSERSDDWSVILWSEGQEQTPDANTHQVISMLKEEEGKPAPLPAAMRDIIRPERSRPEETAPRDVAGDIRLNEGNEDEP